MLAPTMIMAASQKVSLWTLSAPSTILFSDFTIFAPSSLTKLCFHCITNFQIFNYFFIKSHFKFFSIHFLISLLHRNSVFKPEKLLKLYPDIEKEPSRKISKALKLLIVAEWVGFEPTEACTSLVFKTRALNHSTTSPCYFDIIRQICLLVKFQQIPLECRRLHITPVSKNRRRF